VELIAKHIERAIEASVAHHLKEELERRDLLLSARRMAWAAGEAARLGERLLSRALPQCYPALRDGTDSVSIEFDGAERAARVHAALAFGAQTAMVLRGAPERARSNGAGEVLCALFNLGIGLVDGLCDEFPQLGMRLLELLSGRDLIVAAERLPGRGWLVSRMGPPLASDPGAAFAIDVIEGFFQSLHEVYPGDCSLARRSLVGARLASALEAERQSVERSHRRAPRRELIECSRRTSVLPFQIIELLAGAERAREPSVAVLLGEAMWRIDDLVDLGQDASRGALNGVLLAAAEALDPDEEADLGALLERLAYSSEIPRAAECAADGLLVGLQAGGPDRPKPADEIFLYFIQRYAGIEAGESS
jgi:hypothetical protein